MNSRPDPMIGRVLRGTIELKRLIGRGGMGAVYEGYQSHLDRRVAVKVMTEEHARNPMAADYFIREAKQSSALRHPNIIQIIDFGKEDDLLFLAMEFVPGVPLSSIMREESLSDARVSKIIAQVLAALEEAHAKNIIHRDLKPDNIMVEKQHDGGDFVKILDFGIAQSLGSTATAGPLTQAGALVGTPHYMSPEQAEGKRLDGRSDLFSVGIILYELLAGNLPFRGDSLPKILISVLQHEPGPPSLVRTSVASELDAICLRALKKNPDARYPNATEFRNALLGIREQKQEKAPAQLIIKRRKSTNNTEAHGATIQLNQPPVGALDTPAPSPERHVPAGIGADASEVVDTGALFDTSPHPPAITPTGRVDTEALRKDLLGERRTVAVLVLHQRMTRRLDPEELSDTLLAMESRTREIVARWGGLVQQRQGAFTTIIFGVEGYDPQASVKACQGAMDLRTQLKRHLPDILEFGFAVAAGELYLPGQDWGRATGEALESATELARESIAGEIRASETLGPLLESFYKLGPLKSGARAVIGLAEADRQIRVDGTEHLIGRDQEIAIGLSFLASTSKSKGGVLVVRGDTGMGKSALIHDFTVFAEQRAYTVLRCLHRFEGAESVRQAIYQWVLNLARIHGRAKDVDVMCRELGVAAEPTRLLHAFMENRLDEVTGGRTDRVLDEGASSYLALDVAFRALLVAVSQTKPVLLVCDEMSEVSSAFSEWAERFLRFAQGQRVGLVLGIKCRESESLGLSDSMTTIALSPLDDSASRAIMKIQLPAEASIPLRAELVKLACGVPLHLSELIRIVKSKKVTTLEEAQQLLSKTPDVQSALLSRLFEVSKSAQNLIALLAVLGNQTPGEVLLDIAPEEWEPELQLQQLYRDGYVHIEGEEDDPEVRLQPPVFASIIYDQMSRKMRLGVHRRAAEYYAGRIATEQNPGRTRGWKMSCAYHLIRSEQAAEGLIWLQEVLQEAQLGHEYEVALSVLDRISAIQEELKDPARFEFLLRRVRLLDAIGRSDEAVKLARDIDRADGKPADVAIEAKIELYLLWLKDEDPDLVAGQIRKTLAEARRIAHGDPSERNLALLVRTLQALAQAMEKAKRLAPAAEALLEAIETTERHNITESSAWGPRLIWEPLNQLGRIRLLLKELSGAKSLFELALAATQESRDERGEMQVRANLSVLMAHENRLDAAVRSLQTSLKIARRLNDLQAVARLRHNEGLLALRQRRSDLALEAFEESLALSETIDFREGIAMNTVQLQSLQKAESHFMKPRG